MGVLEVAEPVEAALARQQAVDGDAGEGAGAGRQVGIVLGAGRSRPSRPAIIDFSASCGVSNRKSGSAISFGASPSPSISCEQIGGEGEGGDIGGGRQKLLEVRGVVAFQRRARIVRLQAFELGALAKTSATASATAMPRRAR